MAKSSTAEVYCKQGWANPYECRRNPIIGCDCGFHKPMYWDKDAQVWRDRSEVIDKLILNKV
jgi:hypothetical protein